MKVYVVGCIHIEQKKRKEIRECMAELRSRYDMNALQVALETRA